MELQHKDVTLKPRLMRLKCQKESDAPRRKHRIDKNSLDLTSTKLCKRNELCKCLSTF